MSTILPESSNQPKKLRINCELGCDDWIDFYKKDDCIYINAEERGRVVRGKIKNHSMAKLIKQVKTSNDYDTFSINGTSEVVCNIRDLDEHRECTPGRNLCSTMNRNLTFSIERRGDIGAAFKIEAGHIELVFISDRTNQKDLFFDFFKHLNMKGGNKKMKDLITTNCIEEESDSLTLINCNDGKEFAFKSIVDNEELLIFMEKEKAIMFAKLILENAELND